MDSTILCDKDILNYISKDGKLIPQRCLESVLVKHGFYDYIIHRYSNNTLNSDDAEYLRECLYRLINGIEIPPICRCGNKVVFKNNSYPTYCSRKCSNEDPEVLKKISESCSKSLKKAYKERGDDIKEKRRKSLSEKYGVDLQTSSPFGVKEIQDFASERVGELYGVENVFQLENARIKRIEKQLSESIKLQKERGVDIEYLDNGNIMVHNCCSIHGDLEFTKYEFNIRYNKCRKDISTPCYICRPFASQRSGEEKHIADFIKTFYFGVIVENDRSVLDGLEIDIYLPEIKVGFEFNGDYWHMNPKYYKDCDVNGSSGLTAKEHWDKDMKKTEIAKSKGVSLYHIWESDLQNPNIYDYIKSIINAQSCEKNISYCGITKKMLFDWCLKNDFPGTEKWEPNHPIWDSYLPGKLSPRDAWHNEILLLNAVNNLYWILDKSIKECKYDSFVNKHMREFEMCVVENGDIVYSSINLLIYVLNRFTVAKIAPKVTALSANDMKKILDDSKIDISNGVYLPMAGFGGIKKAVELWYDEHNTPKKNGSWDYLIEAYDINENFCKWYGWVKRDVLSGIVNTNKICIVCPPFGKTYEHWNGTPNEMCDISFKEWYKLIKEYVIAPNYIIIGPEIDKTGTGSNKGLDKSGKKRNGLFTKTTGIMRWTDEDF